MSVRSIKAGFGRMGWFLAWALAMAAPAAQAQVTPQLGVVEPAVRSATTTVPAERRWSVYWGWNREVYSRSTIHFTGRDHDFTLHDVQARDSQAPAGLRDIFHTYLNPGRISIPQTNLRVAYQWDADTAVAFNLDHMKYVVTTDQVVPISGAIQGVARTGTQKISTDFLAYEHTDGLNVITAEYEKQRALDPFGAAWPVRGFVLAGAGVVLPKSNVTLAVVGQRRNDRFHLAGYSVHVGAGVDVDVFGDCFVRTAYKTGYVDLPDVRTSARSGDGASQHFTYQELILAVGTRF